MNPHAFVRSQELSKKCIPQLTRGSFHTRALADSLLCHIAAIAKKLQPVRARQSRDKLLIRLRLRPAQLMVEMNDGENDAKLVTQLKQQTKQRNGIDAARNRNTNPVSCVEQFQAPDVRQHTMR